MAKTATERQTTWRNKKMDRKRFIGLTAEKVLADVQVFVERTPWQTLKITYDMAPETYEVLELYCATKGHGLDDLLEDLNAEVMAKWAAKAKQQLVKDRHNRLTQIAELRKEQAKLQAEIASLGNYPARHGE